jgi:hypothetical protein
MVGLGRFERFRCRYYTPDWEPIPFEADNSSDEVVPRPASLLILLKAAAYLGRDFDYMRIDFYVVDDEVWFGEFTPYPTSGLHPMAPYETSVAWGEMWQLPTEIVTPGLLRRMADYRRQLSPSDMRFPSFGKPPTVRV